MGSDTVFAIDVFQSDPDNDRQMCPTDKAHGPMFAHISGQKMLCNDGRCKTEIPTPRRLYALSARREKITFISEHRPTRSRRTR